MSQILKRENTWIFLGVIFGILIGLSTGFSLALLIFAFLPVLIIIISIRPELVVALLIINLAVEYRFQAKISFTNYEIILFLCLLVLLLLRKNNSHDSLGKNSISIVILIFCIYSIINGLLAPNLERALSLVRGTIEGFLFYIMLNEFAIRRFNTRQWLRWLTDLFIYTGTIAAIIGLIQYFTGGFGWEGIMYPRGYLGNFFGIGNPMVRLANGGFEHFNTLAQFLDLTLPLSVVLIFMDQKNKKYWLCSMIMFLGLIVTYSRGGLLGLFISLLFVCLVLTKYVRWALVLVGCFMLYKIKGLNFTDIADTEHTYIKTFSYDLRTRIWYYAWLEIIGDWKNFFFGTGQGSFITVTKKYARFYDATGTVYNAHNIYLLIWLEMGLIGLISFISIIISHIKKVIKIFKHNCEEKFIITGLLASIIAFMTQGIFDHALWGQGFKLHFFGYLALLNLAWKSFGQRIPEVIDEGSACTANVTAEYVRVQH